MWSGQGRMFCLQPQAWTCLRPFLSFVFLSSPWQLKDTGCLESFAFSCGRTHFCKGRIYFFCSFFLALATLFNPCIPSCSHATRLNRLRWTTANNNTACFCLVTISNSLCNVWNLVSSVCEEKWYFPMKCKKVWDTVSSKYLHVIKIDYLFV